ncbi:MAG: hypothetical protein JSS50_02780 [Proteobacteria bacterium]|nr:hypothetical protein [Pseudomonadota bacterium]
MKLKKFTGALFFLNGVAAFAPAISDVVAASNANPAFISAYTACGGLLAAAAVAGIGYLIAHNTNEDQGKMSYIPMCLAIGLAAIAAVGLIFTSIAAGLSTYALPAALPNTLSGMLLMQAGVAQSALVGQEVWGVTAGFLCAAAVCLSIAAVIFNGKDWQCCVRNDDSGFNEQYRDMKKM